MQKVFDCGIDLGTTNSCAAIADPGSGYLVIDNQTDRMSVTPSAISMNAKQRIQVGQRAYNSQKVDNLAVQFKRLMGTDKVIHFASAKTDWTPEQCSAQILQSIRSDVEGRLNRTVEHVLITVPAAFKTIQCEATKKAAEMAGFKEVILLQEPIAAAVAYGAQPEGKDKVWMVFDYGGGTLDVAIISTRDGKLKVINSEGNNFFGGTDLDRLLLETIIIPAIKDEGYAVEQLLNEGTSAGRSQVRKLLLDCESLKIALSRQETAVFELFDLEDDNGDEIELELEIERSEFNDLIAPTVEKSIEIAKSALKASGYEAKQLDSILLVGGSTYIPLVRQMLKDTFMVPLNTSMDPMSVVAGGAAIYASSQTLDVAYEEPSDVSASDVILNMVFDPITSSQSLNIIGTAKTMTGQLHQIKVDCFLSDAYEGSIWTSGWENFDDSELGIFDMNLKLEKNRCNYFKVSVRDQFGKLLNVCNSAFEVRHSSQALKHDAPPATSSISVLISDQESQKNILHCMIKKNTPLPARAQKTFKLSKNIDPNKNDSISIAIWEGEVFDNPRANFPAGEIIVQSSQMKELVNKGTEIDLTITEDENRNIFVSGYIPALRYEIPEETLRPEYRDNTQDRFMDAERRLEDIVNTLNTYENNGMDVSIFRQQISHLKGLFSQIGSNYLQDEKRINDVIQEVSDMETELLRLQEQDKINEEKQSINRMNLNISKYGNSAHKKKAESLIKAYETTDDSKEKQSIKDQITSIHYSALVSNFSYLKAIFESYLCEKSDYSDPKQVILYKKQALQAIQEYDTDLLAKAVIGLLLLIPDTVNSDKDFADLML